MTTRIVQLTDLHLRASVDDARWQALLQLLRALPELAGPVDRLIITGDIATRGQMAVYRALRERLADWLDKLQLVPGNHDRADRLREVFHDRMAADATKACFTEELDGWRLIGLDSSRRFRVSGAVGRAQLAWLQQTLPCAGSALLFMHHPPVPIGTWWLDKDCVRDRHELARLLARGSVRGVACGHVHQAFTSTLGAIPVWTTPSTAYQFAPGSWLPHTERVAPGFRVFELADREVQTRVVRVT